MEGVDGKRQGVQDSKGKVRQKACGQAEQAKHREGGGKEKKFFR